MNFKAYECDFGIKYNGVNYDFDHVLSAVIEDPENTKLIRGSNAGNKLGLIYKEGLREPKRMTITIMGMTAALKEVLDAAYKNKDRLDAYCIARADGSGKVAKNAILCQQPIQLTVDESPDSMNVALAFESFDMDEVHKS